MTVIPPPRTGWKGVFSSQPALDAADVSWSELEWNGPESRLRQFPQVCWPEAHTVHPWSCRDQLRPVPPVTRRGRPRPQAGFRPPALLFPRETSWVEGLTDFPAGWGSSGCFSQAGGTLPAPNSRSFWILVASCSRAEGPSVWGSRQLAPQSLSFPFCKVGLGGSLLSSFASSLCARL